MSEGGETAGDSNGLGASESDGQGDGESDGERVRVSEGSKDGEMDGDSNGHGAGERLGDGDGKRDCERVSAREIKDVSNRDSAGNSVGECDGDSGSGSNGAIDGDGDGDSVAGGDAIDANSKCASVVASTVNPLSVAAREIAIAVARASTDSTARSSGGMTRTMMLIDEATT